MDAKSRKSETCVGIVILMTLAGIAFWVYLKQLQYDPAVFMPVLHPEERAFPEASGTLDASWFQSYLPEGFNPLSSVEAFGPENLSEKIDGKAELYLSAGFVKLVSRRFVKSGQSDSWFEVYVYDMGSTRNAFSVYSSQRRADGEDVDFTRFAYHSRNALFFVHGREYVEVVASSESLIEEMLALGRNFVAGKRTETGEVNEIALFPKEALEEGSITLLSSDVFGYQELNNVFIAHYLLGGKRFTLFLSARKDPREADSLAASYRQFLLENGGKNQVAENRIPGLKIVEILDSYEFIFAHRHFLAGVHEADDIAMAEELAVRLYETLAEVTQ